MDLDRVNDRRPVGDLAMSVLRGQIDRSGMPGLPDHRFWSWSVDAASWEPGERLGDPAERGGGDPDPGLAWLDRHSRKAAMARNEERPPPVSIRSIGSRNRSGALVDSWPDRTDRIHVELECPPMGRPIWRGRSLRHVIGPVAAGVLVLAAGSAVGTTRAAHAAATDCPAEEVCVWSGPGYTGPVRVIQDETCDTAAVRSAANNDPDTLQELRVYARPGCVGPVTVLRHGMQAQSLDGQSYTNYHDPADPVN
jgi:Peptidase inhibitor family I36